MRLQTPQDDKMTLKLSGKSDDVLVALLGELGLASSLPKDPKRNVTFTPHQCALVPYEAMTGMRLPDGKPKMWLDLRPGAKVKLITDGPAKHNHQGAKQPTTIHIGSEPGQCFDNKPIPRAGKLPGKGTVVRREENTCSVILKIEGTTCRLGLWWLEAAVSGEPAMLPLVNESPLFEGSPEPPDPSGGKQTRNAAAAKR